MGMFSTTPNSSSGLRQQVRVGKKEDFGIIDSTKEYFLDGIIDMADLELEVPAGGIFISGYNFNLSGLISSEDNYTLFTSPVGGSGDILFMDMLIDISGTNSKVYDIKSDTGFEAIEVSRINYNNCTSLGNIDNYRQGLESGTGRFGGQPELTLTGIWVGGFFIDTSIVRNLANGAYSLFKAGTGFSMASRFRSNQNIDLPVLTSFIDFSASNFINPSTLQLEGCLISRGGVFDASDTNILPNIDASALVSKWSGNNGISNTFEGGELNISAETTTVINSSGTFVDIAGTYVANDLQHFDSPTSGQLRHLGTSPKEYKVTGQLVIDSTSNDEVDLKVVVFRSATTSFEDAKTIRRVINNLQGGRNVAYYALFDVITLNQNDYVKLQVANVNSTDDITAEIDSFIRISER